MPHETNARLNERYVYRKVGDKSTDQVAQATYRVGECEERYAYTYDAAGNVTKVNKDGYLVARYHYDACNRLAREDNAQSHRTMLYTYDAGGNLIGKIKYPITEKEPQPYGAERMVLRYDVDHPDRMTSYGSERCTRKRKTERRRI